MTELDRCRDWIEAALEYSNGTHLFEDICKGVQEGTLQLWPAPKGCMVTEILQYPKKKVLNIFLAGGELKQLIDMRDDMIAWAEAQGCQGATLTGRKGWVRVLEKQGWKPLWTTLALEFDEWAH